MPEVDLDKLRDQKCIPVARAVFADMSQELLPADANVKVDFAPVTLKALTHAYNADLNLVTENTYVFQLILKVLSRLNVTVNASKLTPADDERYARIGQKILQMVVAADISFDPKKEQAAVDPEFNALQPKFEALFEEEKLTAMEMKYIMDSLFTSFNTVTAYFAESTEQNLKRAEAKAFGLEDMDDLSMKKLDSFLVANATSKL